jgi:hypothetical protein
MSRFVMQITNRSEDKQGVITFLVNLFFFYFYCIKSTINYTLIRLYKYIFYLYYTCD